MIRRLTGVASASALAFGLVALHPANAAVLSNISNTALSATPVTISIGGVASFVFTADNSGFFPMAAVATTGTGKVITALGQVSDFSAGATIDGNGIYSFAPYATAASIPFSAADDFIGFSYTASDGTHYGYAEVNGAALVGYGYQSTALALITTGAAGAAAAPPTVGTTGTGSTGTGSTGTGSTGTGSTGTGSTGTGSTGTCSTGTGAVGTGTSVPEPASAILLLGGLAVLGVGRLGRGAGGLAA